MMTFLKYHLPAILYAALIIIVSSMSNLTPPSVGIVGVDKLAHFFEYAILAVLVFRSFSHLSSRMRPGLVFLLSLLFVAIFALFDECFQAYIPGRHSDVYDIVFDLLGSWLILGYLWYRTRQKASTR
ncbi:MAG: VanZ family protein [candidate division Zixibacteria bacterium]|nr:VanZ family protein [candidate division Zixibacteria bacterium]